MMQDLNWLIWKPVISVQAQTWYTQIVEGGALGNFVSLVFLGIQWQPYLPGIVQEWCYQRSRQGSGRQCIRKYRYLSATVLHTKHLISLHFRGSFGNDVLNIPTVLENFGYLGGKNILKSAPDYPGYKAEYPTGLLKRIGKTWITSIGILKM